MDFQTHQDQAKQNTFKLMVLLLLGLLVIVAVTTALLIALFWYSSGSLEPISAVSIAAPLTTIGIGGTSLVKTSQLRSGGGSYVAASLGGRPIDFNTLDADERQLSNIVEEIAIASGMPVPNVFILDKEPGINAFAAGWTADNAAIGITRGALTQLNRRELQGVIAHEFSHIRNGDTKMNTRVIGWVFGILAITFVGRLVFEQARWASYRSKDKNQIGMALLAVGAGLMIVGYGGAYFARLVQAAVSRQREYLADASAVQYTRDPDGIGNALAKIGGMGRENKVHSAHATEASHLFFASSFLGGMNTHPPLKKRIKRLLPAWNGEFIAPQPVKAKQRPAQQQAARPSGFGIPGMPGIPGVPADLPIDPSILIGAEAAATGFQQFEAPTSDGPTQAHIDHAHNLIAAIPTDIQNSLHTTYGATLAIIGLLASPEGPQRIQQLQFASQLTGLDASQLDQASRSVSNLDRVLHLPAVDIALQAIRQLPYESKMRLRESIEAIEASRDDQDLFRWVLRRVVIRHLQEEQYYGAPKLRLTLDRVEDAASVVLAIMSSFNDTEADETQKTFTHALNVAGLKNHMLPPAHQITFIHIDDALTQLANLAVADKQQFVKAAMAAILQDGKTTAEEAELIRVIADAVGQPVPPLLPVS